MTWRTRIFLGLIALGLLALGLAALLALQVAPELLGARRVLSKPVTELSTKDLGDARDHLVKAQDALDGPAGTALRFLPVARQNVDALGRVTEAMADVVEAGLTLKAKTDDFGDEPLFSGGAIDAEVLDSLAQSLEVQAQSLTDLEESLKNGRNGWLLPPLWGTFESTLERVAPLANGVRNGVLAMDLVEPMLGVNGDRTYLVVLLNNAELRGAGGLPSGAGVLNASQGRITLGEFLQAKDLRGGLPYEKVDAPADFVRRWGQYGADTTLWVNSTMSPDTTDVAEVVSVLAAKRMGGSFDGVVFADPTGLASLVAPNAEMGAPGGVSVKGKDLGDYVMSDAYDDLAEAQRVRKETLVDLGRSTFGQAVDEGYSSVEKLGRVGDALRGGHLRVVSFDADEQRTLDRLDVSGRLVAPSSDALLVTAQNTGADKLDYWTRRSIGHHCSIQDELASCSTSVTLENEAPDGLTSYVANEPYGLLRNYLEVYVPATADLTDVRRDGKPVPITRENQSGYTSVGASVEVPRGESTKLTVRYELALESPYSFELFPQPLAHDAEVEVGFEVPEGWVVRGPEGKSTGAEFEYEGELAETLRFTAGPESRSGLAGAWASFTSFWSEPIGG
ncbi:MAG TPA: DUF4012 domain-containing protein [Acidimicrobiia bacterium]|nr:DUF4012 domain-containing protein [Acidimicrobiia bacterium]